MASDVRPWVSVTINDRVYTVQGSLVEAIAGLIAARDVERARVDALPDDALVAKEGA